MPTSPQRRNSRPGFTVAELLVVLGILALLGAMVVAGTAGGDGTQARAAARQLASDIRYAQSLAVTHQKTVGVYVDPPQERYYLADSGGTVTHPVSKKPYAVRYGDNAPYDRVDIAGGFGTERRLTFDATGAPDKSGSVTLQEGGQTWVVSVAPVTGKVTVSQQ